MKPVFKCEYCNFMGTQEEVSEHEIKCPENYDKRNCLTCIHNGGIKSTEDGLTYKCKAGNDIPSNHIYEHCYKYERKEKPKSTFNSYNPFGWFGF